MTAAGPAPRGAGVSIGTVLARLRPEFPDVTISKIRFLESEGLIRPARTTSGYRQFSPADVERLRYILAAQRDHYLPLKVIRQQLEESDRGAPVRGPRPLVGLDADPGASGEDGDATEPERMRLTREELLEQAEVDDTTLAELETHGVLRAGPAGFYDREAVLVARTAAAMTGYGLEARHLRAFRVAADREAGLLAQIVAPVNHRRDPDAHARADEVGRELAGLSTRLHALLVQAGLRDAIGDR